MEVKSSHLSYKSTGYFSKIVIDYLDRDEKLKPFYQHNNSREGIQSAIEFRQKFNTNRKILVKQLQKQYEGLPLNELQQQNLTSLLDENTFTITTAHQPNIFTGPLYFIYKIMHSIKLANQLKIDLPAYNFVPFYYMGSEDADLEEIGTLTVGGEKLVWQTNQTGAVGRMKVDESLLKLIDRIHGQIGVNEFGVELTQIFKVVYTLGKTIQQASLELVNILFQQFGLLILIPDNSFLKEEFNQIINKEIEFNFSTKLLQRTINQLSKHYKVQTAGREINLFYLYENHRERIEQEGELFVVKKLNKSFQLIEIQEEIKKFPERFSANVILRGVFQETILPNIVFIGGGGELAYWLELKEIFKSANVPYPVLVLRNSFLLISKKQQQVIVNHGIELSELFLKEFELIQKKVLAASSNQLNISDEIDQISRLYTQIEHLATLVDGSLANHIQALKTKALNKLAGVEKKMIRSEKRNFSLLSSQIHQLKQALFPNESLQERVENFSLYYSKYGNDWLNTIYQSSLALEQQFTVVYE